MVCAAVQGAQGYNNTDGASYVTIKNTPATAAATPVAAAAAGPPSRIVTEDATSGKPQQQKPNLKGRLGSKLTVGQTSATAQIPQPPAAVSSSSSSGVPESASGNTSSSDSSRTVQDLDALFAAATKGNYTYQQWVKASASKVDASGWRRLITWPFGEDGGVFRLNKAGNALYLVSSLGR